MAHPLDPLSAEEIEVAVAAVRSTGRLTDAARFATITLDDTRGLDVRPPDHCH